jgi:hypothetical protein
MKDARRGCTPEQIKQMCALYGGSLMTVRSIARQFNISQDRLMAILTLEKVPRRGRAFAVTGARRRLGKKRTIGSVFCGIAKDELVYGPPEVEAAKTKLRRRGCVVFDAEVTDGSAGKGFIKCDGKRVTPAELIERAALV